MQPIQRILLSRMKFIGDVVLTTPVIKAVREQYPDAYIAYLGDKQAVSLLENNPHLNEIIPYDFSKPSILESPRIIFQLRRRKFDAVVDLFCNPRTALLMYASGARIRIGKKVEGRGKLYTHQIEDTRTPKTAIQFHYQYVAPLGVKPTQFKTEIFLTDLEQREAKQFLTSQFINNETHSAQPPRPIIGINPGATWPAKKWLKDRFAELSNLLVNNLNADIVLMQGPKDGNLAEEIAKQSPSHVSILPATGLRQLAAVLSQLSLFITNDNGTMHIATAVGTKTIGIFGPGEENIWFPYKESDGNIALRKNVACHPCHLDICNREGDGFMECMKLLTVDEVFQQAEKLLSSNQ